MYYDGADKIDSKSVFWGERWPRATKSPTARLHAFVWLHRPLLVVCTPGQKDLSGNSPRKRILSQEHQGVGGVNQIEATGVNLFGCGCREVAQWVNSLLHVKKGSHLEPF